MKKSITSVTAILLFLCSVTDPSLVVNVSYDHRRSSESAPLFLQEALAARARLAGNRVIEGATPNGLHSFWENWRGSDRRDGPEHESSNHPLSHLASSTESFEKGSFSNSSKLHRAWATHLEVIRAAAMTIGPKSEFEEDYEALNLRFAKAWLKHKEVLGLIPSAEASDLTELDVQAGLTPEDTVGTRAEQQQSGFRPTTALETNSIENVAQMVRSVNIHPIVFDAVVALNSVPGIRTSDSGPDSLFMYVPLKSREKILLRANNAAKGLPLRVTGYASNTAENTCVIRVLISGKVKLKDAKAVWDMFARRLLENGETMSEQIAQEFEALIRGDQEARRRLENIGFQFIETVGERPRAEPSDTHPDYLDELLQRSLRSWNFGDDAITEPLYLGGGPISIIGALGFVTADLAANIVRHTSNGRGVVAARQILENGRRGVEIWIRDIGNGITNIPSRVKARKKTMSKPGGGVGLRAALYYLVHDRAGRLSIENKSWKYTFQWFNRPKRETSSILQGTLIILTKFERSA